jgi:hypothetical protein
VVNTARRRKELERVNPALKKMPAKETSKNRSLSNSVIQRSHFIKEKAAMPEHRRL